MPEGTFQDEGSSFKRKLSKREKKQLKKQEKLNRIKSAGNGVTTQDENDSGVAEKLYTGTDHLTIGEVVMKHFQIIERPLDRAAAVFTLCT